MLAVKDLLAAIEDDRQPECSMYEGRTTIEMISAVFESHRTGGPVTLAAEDAGEPAVAAVNPKNQNQESKNQEPNNCALWFFGSSVLEFSTPT